MDQAQAAQPVPTFSGLKAMVAGGLLKVFNLATLFQRPAFSEVITAGEQLIDHIEARLAALEAKAAPEIAADLAALKTRLAEVEALLKPAPAAGQ